MEDKILIKIEAYGITTITVLSDQADYDEVMDAIKGQLVSIGCPYYSNEDV